MKKSYLSISLALLFSLGFMIPADAQLKGLKDRLKRKAESAAKSVIGDDEEENNSGNSGTQSTSGPSKGKKLTPPNVSEHLSNASSALGADQYSNARLEVKEAMRGVEIEIGYKLLELMPNSAAVLYPDKEKDQVYSTGIGFVGLVVSRTYGTADKRITATIGDNSIYGASYSMLINSSYAANDGNHKNVTVQGYRGAITFDGDNDYTLGVPIAQSSIFLLECDGCGDEDELMKAAEDFSLSDFEDLLTDDSSDGTQRKEASDLISSASSSYSSKDFEATRYNLQRALVEIDVLIGKMVLDMLPSSLAGLNAVEGSDEHVATAAGFAGVYVMRTYASADESQTIEFSLIDDSPMMGAVSSFMSSPLMVGLSGKKSIKIDGYKGMFEAVEDSDPLEHNINIPYNQSLLTLKYVGFGENKVTGSANQVPVGDIFRLIR
jgi:hypothetical protein